MTIKSDGFYLGIVTPRTNNALPWRRAGESIAISLPSGGANQYTNIPLMSERTAEYTVRIRAS